jgi:hypothetical protein
MYHVIWTTYAFGKKASRRNCSLMMTLVTLIKLY